MLSLSSFWIIFRQLSLDLQKTTQKKLAEEEAWYRQQELLLQAEDKRRRLITEEEEKLADQRTRSLCSCTLLESKARWLKNIFL